jgi:hypothetical protein
LRDLKKQYSINAVIINGENTAGGFGITPEIVADLIDLGVDLITSGNHIWNKNEIIETLAKEPRLLRPHNMPMQCPGSGIGFIDKGFKQPLAVVNLIGRVFMQNVDCPFRVAADVVANLRQRTQHIIVDFHAEATSEKRALAWYLAGSVSAVLGTHTHVQTADEEILPGGTAYITDVGMTGPHDSVIGVEKAEIIDKFIHQMPMRFRVASSGLQINAVVVRLNEEGRAESIERIRIKEIEE